MFVAKLELKWQEGILLGWHGRYLDFVVDGCRFRDRIPWADVAKPVEIPTTKLLGDDGIVGQRQLRHLSPGLQAKAFEMCSNYPTRLGQFHNEPDRWWQEAISQLLLEKPPGMPVDGCPLFTCPGCSCHYVSARIERESGFFVWRHFTVVVSACPPPVNIELGPFYFEERNYVETLGWARKALAVTEPRS